MITLGGAMHEKSFFEDTKYDLDYLGIGHLNKEELLDYMYNGNYIEITNGKIITKYCHMDKLLVKEGKKVKLGEKIGLVGSTGLSTGPHLHFEILYDGIKVNPQKVIDL